MAHHQSFIGKLQGVVGAVAMLLVTSPVHAAWQTPGTATTQEIAAAQEMPQQTGITTSISAPTSYFNITTDDVSKAIAEQMQLQAVEQKASVAMSAGSPQVLYSADHPLKLTIHALQIDQRSKRWQAQAYILANGKTETVKPISGTYMALIDVPVLTRQLGRNDVIEQGDIAIKSIPDRQLRKDTVTDVAKLIGQSPHAVISANRPIRQSEVNSPILIRKGDAVQMSYTNPFMSIKTSGIALQDGAVGEMVRVKNDKSEKAVSGRVVAAGRIEVNNDAAR